MKNELAVVMPVYNEEGAIRGVVLKWSQELSSLGIDFVIHVYNDGSKDGSLKILKEIAKECPRIEVHDKTNSGHGPTILRGYVDNSDAAWTFQIDSDDEIDTIFFRELWGKRDVAQFIVGRRIRDNQPFSRRLVSFVSRLSVRLLYGNKVYDVNCPYRLMKNSCFRELFSCLPKDLFAPNVVISGAVSVMGLKFFEVPVVQKNRTSGVVSIKKMKLLKAAIKSFWQAFICSFIVKRVAMNMSRRNRGH